jgi:FAD:protein FMN transferase
MKKLILYPALFVLVFLAGYKIAVDQVSDDNTSRTRILLGTVVNIQVSGEDEETASSAIEAAFNEIKRIEMLFSNHSNEGYVHRINNRIDSVIMVDTELYSLMKKSDSLYHLTGGAFDISLQQVVELWGFEDKPSLPGEAALRNVLNSCGWDKVRLQNGKYIRSTGVKLNFGAVAKGYAVDRAVDMLKKHEIKRALVDAGGEIKTIGDGWKVGIQDPNNQDGVLYVLDLKGMSTATSGDYEQYFEEDGIRYHHILDPSTGYPGRKCRSVTVISEENYYADGLATGVFIMGPDEGMKLIERTEGTEALIIDEHGKITMSSGFNNFLIR